MKNKFFVLLIILILPVCVANADFSIEHQKDIILLPDSNYTLPILVENLAEHKLELNIICSSDLTVSCPGRLELERKEIKVWYMQIETKEKGIYSVNFQIDNASNKLDVEVSNIPEALIKLLDYYNFTLNRLLIEKGNLKVHEIEQADRDLQVAYELYRQGLYYQSNKKLEEVKDNINEGAAKLLEEKLKMESVTEKQEQYPRIFIILITAIIFVCLFCLYRFLAVLVNRRKRKISFSSDVSNIKNNFGNFEIKNIINKFDGDKKRIPLKKLIETDIKSIKDNINSIEKDGRDIDDIKLWLRFAKEKYKKGQLYLAKRYIDKIKSEIMEGI